MPSNIRENKHQLRQQLKAKRNLLTQQQMEHSALACCDLILQSKILGNTNNIAIYLQHQNEINPQPLIEALWDQGKQLYLPVIEENNELSFAHYEKNCEMRTNPYGITEPVSKQLCHLNNFDVIFMPLVAFDDNGHRLGMGGGYYDRSLANRTNKSSPCTVGLAYEFQKVEQIPTEDWDQAMDFIATDQKIYQTHKF